MKTKQNLRKCIAGFISAVLLISLISGASVRADNNVSISVSGNQEVGSTITVSAAVTAGGVYSGFDGSFSYDSNCLQLQSITSGNYAVSNFKTSGNNFVEYDATINSGSVIAVAVFTCTAAGSSSVTCVLDSLGPMDGSPDISASASASISITAPVPKSSNADLSSLAISPGTLSPSFSAGTQSYTTTVASNQSKITVSAVPADGKASVSLNGVQNSLAAGTNTVKITVTAQNGATKVYTITVTRTSGPTPTPTPTPKPLPLMNYEGTDYTILTAGSSDSIPEGFTAATAKFSGVDIPVLQKKIGDAVDASVMTIVLLTADAKTGYFVYDTVNETCYPYQLLAAAAASFQILDKSSAASVPEGYEAFDYTYQDTKVTAYRLISDPENPQVLLYLMDAAGVSSFYYYDTENGMLMVYRGAVAITTVTPAPSAAPVAAEAELPTIAAAPNVAGTPAVISFASLLDYTNPVVLLFYALALFCLALLVFCIVLIARKGKPDNEFAAAPYLYDDGDGPDPEPAASTPAAQYLFREIGQPAEYGGTPDISEPENGREEHALDFPEIQQKPGLDDTTDILKSDDPDFDPFDMHAEKPAAQPNASAVQPAAPDQQPWIRPMPDVQKAAPLQAVTQTEHVPVRLQRDLEKERVQKQPDVRTPMSPFVNLGRISEPAAQKEKTAADKMPDTVPERKSDRLINDPDFDPDDL